MDKKKKILKRLYKYYLEYGPDNYFNGIDIANELHIKLEHFSILVNQLLRENLVLGVVGNDKKKVALTINTDKISDIKNILNPWYKDPKYWVGIILTTIALILSIMKFILGK